MKNSYGEVNYLLPVSRLELLNRCGRSCAENVSCLDYIGMTAEFAFRMREQELKIGEGPASYEDSCVTIGRTTFRFYGVHRESEFFVSPDGKEFFLLSWVSVVVRRVWHTFKDLG